MTSARARLQRALLGAYETANRRGWLDSRVAEVVFQRSYFAYKRLVEDPFAKLAAARPELFRGGDVVDVGANIGYTTALFARAVEAGRRVHAFEPEERNFRWLERALAREGVAAGVVANRAAVGARDGEVELWHNDAHHADHRIATAAQRGAGTQVVPLVAVDTYLAGLGWPAVAFVKIDVQGYEHEVLRGMGETIARNPALRVAVEVAPFAFEDLGFDCDAFLADLAAALPRLAILERDGRLRDVAVGDVTRSLGPLGYCDLVCWR